MRHTATYSPDDNKLRLYPASRLDAETYARVKAAGFKWAPKQELFVAPAWTPSREDLLIDLCGEIDDEDKSLVERQEERAERFETYSEKRLDDANRAREAVSQIADNIPLGQPILIGHHSEKHARRDAEKIENGMRKAVKLWETSKYWTDRAAGALAHAQYKELPAVRHRRIKGIEADLRKAKKSREESERLAAAWSKVTTHEQAFALAGREYVYVDNSDGHHWTAYDVLRPAEERYQACPSMDFEQVKQAVASSCARSIAHCDRWIAHYENRLAYENAMLNEQGGIKADAFKLEIGGQVLNKWGDWSTILRLNKDTTGRINSVSTNNPKYPRVVDVETIKDYRPPTKEIVEKVKSATTLPPLCNYAADGFYPITQAQWDDCHKDYRGTSQRASEKYARHRVRTMDNFRLRSYGHKVASQWGRSFVYITDAKTKLPPGAEHQPEPVSLPLEKDLATIEAQTARIVANREKREAEEQEPFALMRESLRGGVKTVSAPQLFPTPRELADKVVALAKIEHTHRILEPSAGTGNLVAAVMRRDPCATVQAVEINYNLHSALHERFGRGNYNCDVTQGDFLAMNGELGTFDRVVMNPPFENGADIKHILHARGKLNPGGRLVAICANGPRQREQLQPIATEWHDLPAGSFAEQGTQVNTAIVIIDA